MVLIYGPDWRGERGLIWSSINYGINIGVRIAAETELSSINE